MLLLGVVLALGSAIAHAAWNTASKTIAPAGRPALQAKPLLWSACIAVSIAGYTTYDGWVVVERGLDPIAYYAVGTVIQVVLWSVIVHGKYAEGLRQLGIHARTVAVLAVLIPTSYVLSLYATLHAPVSLVAAVRSSSLIWVALAAALVLREPIGKVRVAATVLAAAAVVAMVV